MTERAQQKSLITRAIEAVKNAHKDESGMLILTRKVDQGIIISGNILVRVLGVERDRVKIGISAPGEITVLRQELWKNADEPWEKDHRPRNETTSTLPISKPQPSA